MTVTITAQIRKDTVEDGFRTRVDITNVEGISLDVLVFLTDNATFSHVATVFDYETYPDTQAAAAAMNQPFYRARSVSRTSPTIVAAIRFSAVTQGRLKTLAVAWDQAATSFEGDSIVIFDSSTS